MGHLDRGVWKQGRPPVEGGAFERKDSAFRRFVTADGASGFPAEARRYHLFVSLACPWASRAVMVRAMKGLDDAIGMTVVDPDMLENGWTFGGETEPLTGARFLWKVYRLADPAYSGSVTVPVLWDRHARTIVNNESSEIIRMLNGVFATFASRSLDLVPPELEAEIDAVNERIYATLNNGVYRAGFATEQQAYDRAVREVFDTLDAMEERLDGRSFLVGERPTEADIRLFTTAIRFDAVYHGHFKCNWRRLADYPRLSAWMTRVHDLDGVAGTVDLEQIKRHYYRSQTWVNPTGIVPIGPERIFAGRAG